MGVGVRMIGDWTERVGVAAGRTLSCVPLFKAGDEGVVVGRVVRRGLSVARVLFAIVYIRV